MPAGVQDRRDGLPDGTTLVKEGEGQLAIFGGDFTFTDSVQINAGSLWLSGSPTDGNLRSNVFVNPAGEFDFDGNVYGSVFNRGLMVVFNPAITESYGHPWIRDDYHQSADGTLRVHLNSELRIGGNVILEGGTLEIRLPIGGMFAYSNSPQILHADGSITGQFAHVVLPSVFLRGTVNYGVHDITMSLVPVSAVSVVSAAGVGDAVTLASAEHLDQAFAQAGDLAALPPTALTEKQRQFLAAAGVVQNIDDVSRAVSSLDSLSGQAYAGSRKLLLDQFDRQPSQLPERLGRMRDGARPGIWFDSRSRQQTPADADGLRASLNQQGFLAGVDRAVGGNLVVGVAAGTLDVEMDFDRLGSQARMRIPSALVYAHYWRGRWYATAQLQQSHATLQMQRWIDLGDGGRHRAGTELNLDRLDMRLEGGREYRVGHVRVSPFVALDFSSLRSGPFAEQGDTGFELTGPAARSSRTAADFGLRLSRDWRWQNGGWARLDLGASYRHAVQAGNDDIRAAYVGAPNAQFTIPALATGRGSRRLDLDVSAGRGENWRSFVRYEWSQGEREPSTAWWLGAEWRF